MRGWVDGTLLLLCEIFLPGHSIAICRKQTVTHFVTVLLLLSHEALTEKLEEFSLFSCF